MGLLLLPQLHLDASYIQVYQTTTNGGLAFTGNTLGLDKAATTNCPGTEGSIGAFITQNPTLRVCTFPTDNGTTETWALNESYAYLDLPPGSSVLHAELIWAGSFGFGSDITLSIVDTATASFTTPSGNYTVSQKTSTAQSVYDTISTTTDGFYVRSADVTAAVAYDVENFFASTPNNYYQGKYTVGHIPASLSPTDYNDNCCGWVLAVAYSNPNMLTSELLIYTACEKVYSGAPTVTTAITGFRTPSSGTINARLFCSALEGDAAIHGDQFKVGPSTGSLSSISGSNNPLNNFFASQINTSLSFTTDANGKLIQSGSGLLDQRGSFGTYNSDAFADPAEANIPANRQGWDITSIDVSSLFTHDQEEAYTQISTTQDQIIVTSLGLQFQDESPIIQAVKEASPTTVTDIGDDITFTNTFTNNGAANATDLIFIDQLPSGLEYNSTIPLTVTYNSSMVTITGADISTGVDLSSIVSTFASGETITIVFHATVTDLLDSYQNSATLDYAFNPFGTDIPLSVDTNIVTVVRSSITIAPVAVDNFYTTTAETTLNCPGNQGILQNDTGTGTLAGHQFWLSSSFNGTLSVVLTDGSFSYTPADGFSGVDTFYYDITDATTNISNTATVTIYVTPAAVSDSGTTAANTTLTSLTSVLENDLGTDLVVTAATGTTEQGGSYEITSTGYYVYVPPTDYSGYDSFIYTATDSSSQTTDAAVTILVTPIAKDDTGQVQANGVLNGSTLFANDPTQGTLIAYSQPSNGYVAIADNGTYTYAPNHGFSGLDTFTYTILDHASQTAEATVSITVTPIANIDSGETYVNVDLNTTASVLSNDIGVGLNVTSLSTMTTTSGGSVTMASDGTYVYSPLANFSGWDSFTYTMEDQNKSSTTAGVDIHVLPLTSNDYATTTMNQTLLGTSVLGNDQPPPTSPYALYVIAEQKATDQGGQVSLNTDGTYTYIPPHNYIGQDTFTYTAKNSVGDEVTATVTITIGRGAVNPPTSFVGTLSKCEFLNETIYRLFSEWTDTDDSISYYKIYKNGQLISEISASSANTYCTCASSKQALNSYSISAVNLYGDESAARPLQITNY